VADYNKFLPEGLSSWHMPFWESLKEHQVKVQKCDNCGRMRYVPKEICYNCQSTSATWTPISGNGEVYTFTIVRRAPTPAYQEGAPYALIHVTMDEGIRMVGTLQNADPESVQVGQKVKVVYDDVTPDWTLLQFEPA
jgi:uncharacterized OB-fold protein